MQFAESSVPCAVCSVQSASLVQVTASDFTSYRCVAKNSLGETDGKIRLYGGWTLSGWTAKGKEASVYETKCRLNTVSLEIG